ncbi:HAD domain-containing protein [Actinomadura welshii]
MTDGPARPLLFLDVDGPLLPFGDAPAGRPGTGQAGHLGRLDPRAGIRLAALPCELVWATTWEHEANTVISPRIGLPRLPIVNWPDPSPEHEREDKWFGLCWKTRAVVAWANRRSFAWIDDEITDADREWVSMHHPGRALLRHVESSQGLTDDDFAALDHWLRAVQGSDAPAD